MMRKMGPGNICQMYEMHRNGEKKSDFTFPRTAVIWHRHSSTGTVYPEPVQSPSLEVSNRMKPWATCSDARANLVLSRVWPRDLLRSPAAWITVWLYVSPHPYSHNDISKAKTHLGGCWIGTHSETDRAITSTQLLVLNYGRGVTSVLQVWGAGTTARSNALH